MVELLSAKPFAYSLKTPHASGSTGEGATAAARHFHLRLSGFTAGEAREPAFRSRASKTRRSRNLHDRVLPAKSLSGAL